MRVMRVPSLCNFEMGAVGCAIKNVAARKSPRVYQVSKNVRIVGGKNGKISSVRCVECASIDPWMMTTELERERTVQIAAGMYGRTRMVNDERGMELTR